MKKNLIPTAAFILVAIIAATVFAEEAAKPRPKRPERPSSRTPRSRGMGAQRSRGMEAMMQQRTKQIEAEIRRANAAHEAATGELKAILKQAKTENATKTAAMLSKLIEKKNTANAEKVKTIQKRAEEFKKRMQRRPRTNTSRARPAGNSAREKMPPRKSRTRVERPATNK